MRRALRKLLRSPKVIVGELLALTWVTALGAALPQTGTATAAELARLHAAGPLVGTLVGLFALDHIFRSPGFLAVTALIGASLVVIVLEQIQRLQIQWSQRPSEAQFRNAPLQTQFERAPRAVATSPQSAPAGPGQQFWTEGRLGLLGSPVLHIGLLLIIVAGALRALLGAEAAVDLVEGETLPATAAGWSGQWPGVLGRTFQLDCPLTLETVSATHYRDGDLRELKVRLLLQHPRGVQSAELAVNHDLPSAGGRVFLGSDFGPAALLEWQSPGTAGQRQAALLTEKGGGTFEGTSTGPNGLQAFLRARIGQHGRPPGEVEIRVMRDGALLFTGDAQAGQSVRLHSGERLVLHGTPFWVRLRGNRDPALALAYLGLALVLAGAVLSFTVVKMDACVIVTPVGQRERVFVALKPQRFAPLFQERFEQLVRDSAAGLLPVAADVPSAAGKVPARGLPATPSPRLALRILPLLLAPALTGCRPSAVPHARQLVERYNQVVAEAYRRGDVKLIDPVVGPAEGKKLTGLIGVRLDLGLTLDSQLLSLTVTGAEQTKDQLRVTTQERWSYRDRKIGTGEPVGETSFDSYAMLYVFVQTGQAWRVDEIRFTSPPQVGRKQSAWLADRKAVPGLDRDRNDKEIQPP